MLHLKVFMYFICLGEHSFAYFKMESKADKIQVEFRQRFLNAVP